MINDYTDEALENEFNKKVFINLYKEFAEYQKKVKGYFTCASMADILAWEKWKVEILREHYEAKVSDSGTKA